MAKTGRVKQGRMFQVSHGIVSVGVDPSLSSVERYENASKPMQLSGLKRGHGGIDGEIAETHGQLKARHLIYDMILEPREANRRIRGRIKLKGEETTGFSRTP